MLLIERRGIYRFVYDPRSDRYKVYQGDRVLDESNQRAVAQATWNKEVN